jgi:hypothetical protein
MTSIILTGQTDTQKYQQFDHPTKLRYSIILKDSKKHNSSYRTT